MQGLAFGLDGGVGFCADAMNSALQKRGTMPDDATREDGRRARGRQFFDEVYGGIVPYPDKDRQGDFLFNTIDHLFAEVWSRPGMSIRDRRLVLIGIIAAQAEVETLEIQLRAALHKGELTTEDVREIVVLLPYYIGYPRSSRILLMSQRLLAEIEKAAPQATPR